MKGLDLGKLKKVSSDGKTTTFKHDNGHELKVAHSGLSPKLLKELQNLPMHGQKMKDGGEPDPQPNASPDDSSGGSQAPVVINVGGQGQQATPAPQGVPVPAQYNPGISAPGPTATIGNNPNAPQQTEQTQPQPQPSPDDSSQNASSPDDGGPVAGGAAGSAQDAGEVATNQPQLGLPPDTKTELNQEDAAWQHDINNGHITPETYSDLFAKKGTLGKIGMMFGLMVGGAGAGLSHQPNALLGMMNTEIANDLEAQKQSKANAQNFIRLNQQHQMNQADIGLKGAEAKNVMAEANSRAYALSNMQMNRAALHNITQNVNKLPVGSPQRIQAENALAMMYSAVNNENFNIADRAQVASSLAGFGAQQGAAPEQQFQQQNRMLRMSGNDKLAENMENKHFPGIQGQSSVPLTPDDRAQINSGLTFQNQLGRFMDWTKSHSGDLSPSDKKEGEAMAAGLQGAYRQATHGGVYKAGEQDFISSIIDSEPTKFFNKIRVMPSLNAVKKDSAMQLDQLVKSKGFQGYQGSAPGGGSSGEIRYDSQGNAWKMGPNGKPVRAQ